MSSVSCMNLLGQGAGAFLLMGSGRMEATVAWGDGGSRVSTGVSCGRVGDEVAEHWARSGQL